MKTSVCLCVSFVVLSGCDVFVTGKRALCTPRFPLVLLYRPGDPPTTGATCSVVSVVLCVTYRALCCCALCGVSYHHCLSFVLIPATLRQVSLTIVSATGLTKADYIGSSDPYAVVLVNRREIGRTRTLFKTQNPEWSDPQETFPLRLSGGADNCDVVVQLWDEDLGKGCGLPSGWQFFRGDSARTTRAFSDTPLR